MLTIFRVRTFCDVFQTQQYMCSRKAMFSKSVLFRRAAFTNGRTDHVFSLTFDLMRAHICGRLFYRWWWVEQYNTKVHRVIFWLEHYTDTDLLQRLDILWCAANVVVYMLPSNFLSVFYLTSPLCVHERPCRLCAQPRVWFVARTYL